MVLPDKAGESKSREQISSWLLHSKLEKIIPERRHLVGRSRQNWGKSIQRADVQLAVPYKAGENNSKGKTFVES